MTGTESIQKTDPGSAFRKGASIALSCCTALVATESILFVTLIAPMLFQRTEEWDMALPSASLFVRNWYVPVNVIVAIGVLVGGAVAYYAGHRRGAVIVNAFCFIISVLWFSIVAFGFLVPFLSVLEN